MDLYQDFEYQHSFREVEKGEEFIHLAHFLLHLCTEHMQFHQIATKVYNFITVFIINTTKLNMDTNFAENYTFI